MRTGESRLTIPLMVMTASLVGALMSATAANAEESGERRKATLNQLFRVAPLEQKDSALRADVVPSSELYQHLERLQAADPTAEVTWFRGHVDSFSAAPKDSIPKYAEKVLEARGIIARPQKITRFETVLDKKPQVDWDRKTDSPLPFMTEAEATERGDETGPADKPEGKVDAEAKAVDRPILPSDQSKTPPSPKLMGRLAHEVFLGFLNEQRELFEIPKHELSRGLQDLKRVKYGNGRYYQRLVYQQMADRGVLHNGKTLVLLDHNWNVINVSRLLLTERKLRDIITVGEGPQLSEQDAVEKALAAVREAFGHVAKPKVVEATLGLNALPGIYTWKVRVTGADRFYPDMILSLDASSGAILNVSDNVDRYTDASVSRWGYSSGDYTAPIRYTSNNFYTRDDNTLVHDFFHVVTDNRNNGDALHNCNATPQRTDTESAAYGTTSGSNYIRPTRRSDRDFSLWWPSEGSGTFGEAHTYYWARWFMQWMKPALADLGVLPASASDYPQALIIANACEDGVGWHSSSFAVTTLNNIGEGINTIRLPERCRSTNGSCAASTYASSNSGNAYTFEGNAGYSTPGVIHHELNHFVMKRYFDIGSGLDCGSSVQLKFLHEGAAGRSLPQAYWHNYYGSGYAPSNQNRNYRHNQTSGRPHVDAASLNQLSDFYCASDPSPYNAGSVVHQAMWKFYHGIAVDGSNQRSISRLSTDRDFVLLYYWAADLVSASTYQDRYEMANRVMEIMENHSSLSSSGKADWCGVWDVHELDTFINGSYCS